MFGVFNRGSSSNTNITLADNQSGKLSKSAGLDRKSRGNAKGMVKQTSLSGKMDKYQQLVK
jgi:hypothetical protein